VVTGPDWSLLWLDPEPCVPLLEPSLLAPSLPELLPKPSSAELDWSVPEPSSLWVVLELEPPLVELEPAVAAAPPLPSAATASHAATKVASTAAVIRRRTMRRRWWTGGSGEGDMRRIVAGDPQILLGSWYGAGKAAARDAYGASKVT
jgi:hypothetical protein